MNCRKDWGTWVRDRPNLVDILVPFARHEIVFPQVHDFEKEARRRSLRGGAKRAQYVAIVAQFEEATTECQAYRAELEKSEATRAEVVEAENARIVGDWESLTPAKALIRWGYVVLPAEDSIGKKDSAKTMKPASTMPQEGKRKSGGRHPKTLSVAENAKHKYLAEVAAENLTAEPKCNILNFTG